MSFARPYLRLSLLAIAALLLAAPAAGGAPVTLGQTSSAALNCEPEASPYTAIQPQVAGGASYVVPEEGVITSWSHVAGPSITGQMQLKVYRPTSLATVYTVVRESAMQPIAANVLNVFSVSLGVKAGDVIGYSRPANSALRCAFATGLTADVTGEAPGVDDPMGAMTTFGLTAKTRINVSAVLHKFPVVEAVAPRAASVLGGDTVTLTGRDFTEAGAVTFADLPATSFTVVSDTRIDAVVPKRKARGTVDVFVYGPAGRSFATEIDRFRFAGCRVPTLKGRTLKKAKERLRAEECRIGKVRKAKGVAAKTGRVVKQSPKPAKTNAQFLPPGSKVSVKLG